MTTIDPKEVKERKRIFEWAQKNYKTDFPSSNMENALTRYIQTLIAIRFYFPSPNQFWSHVHRRHNILVKKYDLERELLKITDFEKVYILAKKYFMDYPFFNLTYSVQQNINLYYYFLIHLSTYFESTEKFIFHVKKFHFAQIKKRMEEDLPCQETPITEKTPCHEAIVID